MGWVSEGEVPDYKSFTKETAAKRRSRKRRYQEEAKEVTEMKEDEITSGVLS